MSSGRIRIASPPGSRSCGGIGGSEWIYARGTTGATPFIADLEFLKSRFPSGESRSLFMNHLRDLMRLAMQGALPWDMVVQMKIAPDVLELKLPDWHFDGGKMHVRLYFTEPHDLPANLVGLRLLTKRPGPIGLPDQDAAATSASDLLLAFQERGFQ